MEWENRGKKENTGQDQMHSPRWEVRRKEW